MILTVNSVCLQLILEKFIFCCETWNSKVLTCSTGTSFSVKRRCHSKISRVNDEKPKTAACSTFFFYSYTFIMCAEAAIKNRQQSIFCCDDESNICCCILTQCTFTRRWTWRKYSHKKEASANMIGHRTHPDVTMFLQIFRRNNCKKKKRGGGWIDFY